MSTDQQNFETPSAGASDWDGSLNANFNQLESGFRARGRAGEVVNTGEVVTVGSDGFALRFDPNSLSSKPNLLSLTALSSGDEAFFVSFGSVRSLGVWGGVIPGHDVFVSVLTPGMLVSSYSGANRSVGFAHFEDGVVFNVGPTHLPELIVASIQVDAVNGSLHLFDIDVGLDGWNRRLHVIGQSADLVEIDLFTNSSRGDVDKVYKTISGGVTVIGSHVDQAGWPYFNTDPSTYSGKLYGTLKVMSDSVASDDIDVTFHMERFR